MTSATSAWVPASCGAILMAAAASRAERRLERVRRVSSSALVPVPWRSGTISAAGGRSRACQERVDLRQDRAAGSHRARAATRSRRCARRARRPGALRRCGRSAARRARSRRNRRRCCWAAWSRLTTITPSIAAARRSATSTSENIASTSARRGAGSSAVREPLLGLGEALHGEDRGVRIAHGYARRLGAKRERPLGDDAAGAAASSISTSVSSTGSSASCGRRRRGRRSGRRSAPRCPRWRAADPPSP